MAAQPNDNVSSATDAPVTTTRHPNIFQRLTALESDVVAAIIGGFVFVIAVTMFLWGWRKKKSELRHEKHKVEGHLELSTSVVSDISEPYTVSPLVQDIIAHKVPSSTSKTAAQANSPSAQNVTKAPSKVASEPQVLPMGDTCPGPAEVAAEMTPDHAAASDSSPGLKNPVVKTSSNASDMV